jgi:predicted AlkP superfamily pyrophosphatase or phosphodiesterase
MVRSASVHRIHLHRLRRLYLAALLVAGSAVADAHAVETVILLSMDGATPTQISDPALSTLARLQKQGSHAELIPVFPSNTFPNHVSLVTGVRPERHGVVSNVFVDPERGKHSYANDPSWIQSEPL